MKKFIYETQKFIYVDPENEEAMYDGYDPSNSTISEKDFEELKSSENYSIQGGHSYVDYIFGKIEDEDKGDTITDVLGSGTKVVYNKIGEVELSGKERKKKENYNYSTPVNFGYGKYLQKLQGGTAKIEGVNESGHDIIEDNLGAGVSIYGKTEESAQTLLKRVSELPFKLCD